MGFKAIIFDLDGVLCFTDEYHYLAWKATADSIGVPFDRTVNNRLRGVSRMESLDIILEKCAQPLSMAEKEVLAQQKNQKYQDYLRGMTPEDLPTEVKETLDGLRQKGLRLAVGSSSKNTPLILHQIGLDGYFDAVADGNGVKRSKPAPDVFLLAAELLNIDPADCLVVEDAVSGAQAAHAAGMKAACVGDAAQNQAGDYNMSSIRELLELA